MDLVRAYFAASYGRKHEMRKYRDEFQSLGYIVTSRWLDTPDVHPGSDVSHEMMQNDPTYCIRYADADIADMFAADIVVFFTGDDLSNGGRHTEFGIAMAALKRIAIIGPRENVFQCYINEFHYADWSEFINAIHLGALMVQFERTAEEAFRDLEK